MTTNDPTPGGVECKPHRGFGCAVLAAVAFALAYKAIMWLSTQTS
jgi:hypothetical protein